MLNPQFHLFPLLPVELQIQILTHAVEDLAPRDIETWPVVKTTVVSFSNHSATSNLHPRLLMLPLLHTNHLARSITLKKYTMGFQMYLRKKIYVSPKDRIIVHGLTANDGHGLNPMFGLNMFIKAVRKPHEVDYVRMAGIREFQEVKQRLELRVYHVEEGSSVRNMVLLGP
ncbi:hypothetical protein EAF04_006914 [Stromatinia cepivora]|nr:hypothetical protein EAF04_006914 [Stromatinia cepivora]